MRHSCHGCPRFSSRSDAPSAPRVGCVDYNDSHAHWFDRSSTNSHLLNTHRYQLTNAKCNVSQGIFIAHCAQVDRPRARRASGDGKLVELHINSHQSRFDFASTFGTDLVSNTPLRQADGIAIPP
jgi:hypothetical protein